jgi:hypothetical protein
VQMPVKLRQFLGRWRLALHYALGRQAMAKGVTSYDDDVWIVSYPKSGNTWTRFLIANLIAGNEPVDWSNIERLVPDIYYNRDPQLRALPRPRYFKSHEAYRPDYRRVVFIVRDPRDVAVSYYHFVRKAKMLPADATMDDFMHKFLEGRIDPYGNWGENVGSWLGARRGTADFVVVRYEDLLENAEAELLKIAEMLGLPADDKTLQHAVENSRADRMRELEKSQRGQHKLLKTSRADIPFVRAARSGQWRTELPPGAVRQIESAWGHTMRELGYIESPVMEAVK